MKVLKEPTLLSWEIEKECSINKYLKTGCGALLEIETSDIYLTSYQDYCRSEDLGVRLYYDVPIFAFKCPCCGAETPIADKEIPAKVRESIRCFEQNKKAKQKYKESIENK